MITINQDKATLLALTNRKNEIHLELDKLDIEITRAHRENKEDLVTALQNQSQALVTELREIITELA